jgi:hypothetical protein
MNRPAILLIMVARPDGSLALAWPMLRRALQPVPESGT